MDVAHTQGCGIDLHMGSVVLSSSSGVQNGFFRHLGFPQIRSMKSTAASSACPGGIDTRLSGMHCGARPENVVRTPERLSVRGRHSWSRRVEDAVVKKCTVIRAHLKVEVYHSYGIVVFVGGGVAPLLHGGELFC